LVLVCDKSLFPRAGKKQYMTDFVVFISDAHCYPDTADVYTLPALKVVKLDKINISKYAAYVTFHFY
jgi:hypothetical protein